MSKYTTNTNGMLNEVDEFVNEHVANYKRYITGLIKCRKVEELTRNEMAFIRLVSNSSIKSMHEAKTPKSNLDILNTPLVEKSTSRAELDLIKVKEFMSALSAEKRKELFGF